MRKVYPSLIASSIVSVQPMSQPASLIFYLKHRYKGAFILKSGFYVLVGTWIHNDKELLLLREFSGDPDEECVYVDVAENMTEPGQDQSKQQYQLRVEFENGDIKEGNQEFIDTNVDIKFHKDGICHDFKFIRKEMAAVCLT